MEIYEHNELHGVPPQKKPGQQDDAKRLPLILIAVALIVLSVGMLIAIVFSGRSGNEASVSPEPDYVTAFAAVKNSVVEVYGNNEKGNTTGSGVVYKIRGGKTYVISNFHVTGNSTAPQVRFGEYGDKKSGVLLGYDDYHDIALIEVDGDHGCTAVTEADAPECGEKVIAVGNSLGYGIAAFDGIVSRTSRMLKAGEGTKRVPVYAVTTSVNAGMSGGGLFTLDGKIAGINTYRTEYVAYEGESKPVEGMSYSVPFGIADKIARRILDNPDGEAVELISVQGNTAVEDEIDFYGLGFTAAFNESGLRVMSVLPAPSDMRGEMRECDIVTRIGSLAVDTGTPFYAIFEECLKYSHDPSFGGTPLTVTLDRGGESIAVTFENKRLKYA